MSDNKAPNPFSPKSVVPHNLFAGRASQVNNILRKLTQINSGVPSSFFFVGERGIGKTALAKLVIYVSQAEDKELHDLNLLPAYYSVEKGQNTQDVLQAVLNALTDQMSQSILTTLGRHLGNLLRNGKFVLGAFGTSISVDSSSTTERRETTLRDQVISILSNVISATREDQVEKKDGLLLVLDELNNLSDIENCAQLIRGITTTLDVKGKGNISFILIGYRDTVDAFFEGDPSARRQFDEIPLGPMPPEEAADILKKGFGSAGVTWDDAALINRVKVAGGYPHAVQLLGHDVYEADKDGYIGNDDWSNSIIETAMSLQSKEFANMYNFHGKKGDREIVLDVLSENVIGMSRSDLAKKCTGKNIYRIVDRLKSEGSITENDDELLQISSQLLRMAITLSNLIRKYQNKELSKVS